MRRCYYTHDKEAGKVLIPGCMPVVFSDDLTDCICGGESEMTYPQFEKRLYNEMRDKLVGELKDKNSYIAELEEEIVRLNKKLSTSKKKVL